jgi:HEAT repeat protein
MAATRQTWPIALLGVVCFMAGTMQGTDTVRAAWEPIATLLNLQGAPAASSAGVLSEHEIAALSAMEPQQQSELLLERSINHFHGANEQIAARVDGWRARIKIEGRLNNLFTTALNSDDLRVRAAAIEINLAGRNIAKDASSVERLEAAARSGEQGPRANALWDLALLGNRGVEPERVEQLLLASLHDANVNIRYWAVEGLSYLATDAVVDPLLTVLRDDASAMIRERAACGLAQSGMLSAAQRRTALPQLLEYADDGGMDAETRSWVFQALRDITGQTLPHDGAAWRAWYRAHP